MTDAKQSKCGPGDERCSTAIRINTPPMPGATSTADVEEVIDFCSRHASVDALKRKLEKAKEALEHIALPGDVADVEAGPAVAAAALRELED